MYDHLVALYPARSVSAKQDVAIGLPLIVGAFVTLVEVDLPWRMKPEVEYVSAQIFTKKMEDLEELANKNELYPRISIPTVGSIDGGLDS